MIPDGAVLIRDGLIEQPGVTRRIENLDAARGAIEIDAGGRVVMPGFVDSHTHLFYGSRTQIWTTPASARPICRPSQPEC